MLTISYDKTQHNTPLFPHMQLNSDPGQSEYTLKKRQRTNGQTLPQKSRKARLVKIHTFKEKTILFHNLSAVLNYNNTLLQ